MLRRHGRVSSPVPPAPPHRFERSGPNHLWQMDYKGPLAGPRSTRYLLTVLDDHSRYLLALLQGERVGVRVEGAVVVLLYGQRELRRVPLADLKKGRTV